MLHYDSTFPRMDILVRESIQNSFDALNEESECLEMQFNTGKFKTSELSSELEVLGPVLDSEFPGVRNFLEICDMGTSGLSGPTESKTISEYGPFIKLVRMCGEKQMGSGKGGSYGAGKTNYYSVGIGLVIYYSRTVFNGVPEHRLAAVLIQNTDQPETMLIPESQLGISYWGDTSQKYPGTFVPVTDEEKIRSFLKIFNISPFSDNQTGTSIIIPFLDFDRLKHEMEESIFDVQTPTVDWDFKRYTELAVQRWYFPRIMNRLNGSKELRFSFNGDLMSHDNMDLIFRTLQDTYNDTFSDETRKDITSRSDNFKRDVMTIAYTSKRTGQIGELRLPDKVSVYNMFLMRDADSITRRPVLFRCRSLGMINSYEMRGLEDAPACPSGEYQFVCLRPISDIEVIYDKKHPKTICTLEDYIRKGENETHTLWNDVNLIEFDPKCDKKLQLITSMYRRIKAVYSEEKDFEAISSNRNLGLGRAIGKLFLPKTGFGAYPSDEDSDTGENGGSGDEGFSGNGGSGGGGSSDPPAVQKSKLDMKRLGVDYSSNHIIITASVSISDTECSSCIVSLSTLIPNQGDVSIQEWENSTGVSFPGKISSFRIKSIDDVLIADQTPIDSFETRSISGCEFIPVDYNGRMFSMLIGFNGHNKVIFEIDFVKEAHLPPLSIKALRVDDHE